MQAAAVHFRSGFIPGLIGQLPCQFLQSCAADFQRSHGLSRLAPIDLNKTTRIIERHGQFEALRRTGFTDQIQLGGLLGHRNFSPAPCLFASESATLDFLPPRMLKTSYSDFKPCSWKAIASASGDSLDYFTPIELLSACTQCI